MEIFVTKDRLLCQCRCRLFQVDGQVNSIGTSEVLLYPWAEPGTVVFFAYCFLHSFSFEAHWNTLADWEAGERRV